MTSRLPLLLATAALCAFATHATAEPRAQIRGEIDADLKRQLEQAVGHVDGAPANRFEARRRARAALESAQALLRSEGYYQATVQDQVEGEETPVAIVEVTPGRRFVLGDAKVNWSAPAPDADTSAAVIENLQLKPGEPGRAADVLAAEGRLIADLTRRGYADAVAQPRRVVVDHATFLVEPGFNVASGELVRLDGIQLRTSGPTKPDWVQSLVPWREGDRYDPEDVAELERRLLDTGVYDGVGVALSSLDDTRPDGLRPVVVTLADRPVSLLEAGASYSTYEGVGVDVFRTRYNRFGRADTLRYGARIASIDSRIGGEWSQPHWRRAGRTLKLSSFIVNEQTDAYDRSALTLAADLSQRLGKTSWFSYGLGVDAGQYTEYRFDPLTQRPITFDRNLAIVTLRGSAFMDRSNDPLNPTTGYRLSVSAQPTAVTGEDTVMFLRTEGQASAYLPLQDGAKTVLAGRARIGSIIGGEELTIPSDRLFYSGGGGSVRGYSYQSINPRLPDNRPRGGLSLFETSLEVRRDIGEKFQAVAFVDGGAVGFQETPNFSNMRYGAGVGVRYKLPFGPVRADVAFPLNKREGDSEFQLYISIGQAF
ncbi:autotransporter assembly complex protein TamA [Brevundimonas diminuta]|uniref:autotransporter assembly complex protein TamA n=1 Tax=Brevundimonas diminuta TaxID=293 RepID=UPI0002A2245B|nr:autotransporter assembly complex family protein [Brevundimonas diminuta]EKY26779.1 outer membrane protein, OMP85 family [Brevundimonas diminuta 470-4]MCO8018520.1 autotransporter assembly complex protein TamA [Brevundimonas diminuta]MCO8020629.1 autotransporter assembly complex protein TamA [Brevundimonas diminuta]